MKRTLWILTCWMVMQANQFLLLDAKRVVQIPGPSTSHFKYHIKVARALQDLGHQVWIAMPDYQIENGFHDTSNISIIPYETSANHEENGIQAVARNYFSEKPASEILQTVVVSVARNMSDDILTNRNLEQRIRDVQPDLMLLNYIPLVFPLAVLPYKLQVPFAMIGVVYDVHATRIPYSSAANAVPMGVFTDDMTFSERVKSMFIHTLLYVYNPFMPRDAVPIYAPEMPYISNSDLLARAELWLVEMDHILDYPRPTLPNVKLIGGTVADKVKPLPSGLRKFMDEATQGAVIMTFGGSLLGLPKAFSDKLFQVFLNLPFRVVFRSNLTSPDPDKVWTSKWLPQNDLLGHPNTKLFLSHCGKNGQYEALYNAVPLLCNPIFAEQAYNSERIRRKGFGEIVDIRTDTIKELHSRIVTVAQEPRYKLAISKASTLFRQQYGFPMKEAAKWLDHVMQYGGDYMRYAGQKMPLYQFLGLDVFACVFGIGILSCLMMYCCIQILCKCCFKRKPKTD